MNRRGALVIAPHPDDEAIGMGMRLRARPPAALVFLSDGVPRESKRFVTPQASPRAYRLQRRIEARMAASLCGVRADNLFFLDAVDTECHLDLAQLELALGHIAEQVQADSIWSPAYEGGHPDHDVAAFLAARQASRLNLPHFEYALYHFDHGFQQLRFPGAHQGHIHPLSTCEMIFKKCLLASYASQAPLIAQFRINCERYRRAPRYDFRQKPSAQPTLYEKWGWSIRAEVLTQAFCAHTAHGL